jgi:hypothetical protein
MKNIHLIPTSQPSRLVKFFTNKFHLCKEILPIQDEEQYQNIYITNDEEIKEGDWFISLYSNSIQRELTLDWTLNKDAYKKIILTTDQDLIKDGVQSIDDEFLEWFVKNPSCEEVEVLEGDFINGEYTFGKYRIGKMYYAEESKEEPKQETLEEAAEKYSEEAKRTQLEENFAFIDFINGAKWQQERSYSEEEIIQLLNFVSKEYNISNGIGWFHTHESIEDISSKEVLDKWFEQFKKK